MNKIGFASVIFVGMQLVELHRPDGSSIYINPQEVTSVRKPSAATHGHLAGGTNCLVYLVNRNFITTQETCVEVKARLETLGK